MLNPQLRQTGFTLSELMIGSALSLVMLSSLLQLYVRIITGSYDSLRMSHLHQQLGTAMAVMHQDVRRAGYLGVAAGPDSLPLLASNPFTDADDPDKPEEQRNDLRIGRYAHTDPAQNEGMDSCVLYSYDRDRDGAITLTGNGMERYGFRLRNMALQMRLGGSADHFGCSQGSWNSITDPGIEITRLRFGLVTTELQPASEVEGCESPLPCLYIRTLEIELEGRLAHDHDVMLQLRDQVHLRNDRYLASLPL